MIRIFPLVVLVQIFCLYHAYKNNTEQKWFWLIVFLPFIGSIIYLYYHFYNRTTVETVSETITKVVNTNYKVEQLEKEVKFSDTVTNKTQLAEEYVNIGSYDKAIDLYKSCLKGTHADDPDILLGLVKSTYLNNNYDATIQYGKIIESEKIFQNAEERVAYAWALFNTGDSANAEKNFEAMDFQFSNYKQRLEYCNFLKEENRIDDAKAKLSEMIEEIDHMDRKEQRSKRTIYRDIKNFYGAI